MSEAVLDLRSLTSAHEVISYPDGGLFPVQAEMTNGELAVIARGGAGHLGQAGQLGLVRSRDQGLTWTPPAIVVDSDQDDRNPAFGVARDGTVILAYMHQRSYNPERQYRPEIRDSGVRVMLSHDHGLNWSSPETLDPTTFAHFSPFGRISQLPNGRVIMSVYSTAGTGTRTPGAYSATSDDAGATWAEPTLIAAGFDETTILPLPSGELLAACRETARDHQRLWLCRSTDGGVTWSEPTPITGDFQHPADLLLLDDETLLLLYGNRRRPYRVEGLISRDDGRTWAGQRLALSGQLYGYDLPAERATDLGYPSGVVTADGSRLVVSYYVNTFPLVQPRDWTGPWTTPFYRSEGYRGVSVSVDTREVLRALR